MRKLPQYHELHQALKWVKESGQNALITVHHDIKQRHSTTERLKDGDHH